MRSRHSAIVLDDLSTGHRAAVPPLALLVAGGIHEPEKLREAFTIKEIDCVIHLAARSIVSESVSFPDLYERANVEHGRILLDAMREHGVKHLVFSSTAAVYDASGRMPLREDSRLLPGNPYGETKLRFEALLRERAESEGLRSVALRYFNVAGASIDRGEDHREETHLIPLVIDAARGAKGPVPVYGTDYPTEDGTATTRVHGQPDETVTLEQVAKPRAGRPGLALEGGSPALRRTSMWILMIPDLLRLLPDAGQ